MEEFKKMDIESKKKELNYKTRKLLTVLDTINDEKFKYYSYNKNSLNEGEFLDSEYNLISMAYDKLLSILQDD